MEPNGTGMTEQELMALPEVNAALWQDDDGPTSVTDSQGRLWMIGMYQGRLSRGGYGRKLSIPEKEALMDTQETEELTPLPGKRRVGRPTNEEAAMNAYPTPEEATKRRGHRLYRDGEEVVLRVKIPAEMRRNIKIYQLRQNITPDEAVTAILREYFTVNPA